MTHRELILKWILRCSGCSSLSAAFFVAAPYSWMNGIHQWLGLGALPDAPVVGYLARSTSAFYAMLGGLLCVLSFDVRRFRPVLLYLGGATVVMGLTMFIVDWVEGLPPFWRYWEGPLDAGLGAAILWLVWRCDHSG